MTGDEPVAHRDRFSSESRERGKLSAVADRLLGDEEPQIAQITGNLRNLRNLWFLIPFKPNPRVADTLSNQAVRKDGMVGIPDNDPVSPHGMSGSTKEIDLSRSVAMDKSV